MRFFVCCGMERAAGELFRAAETVPGVRPRWSAMVLSVTRGSGGRGCFFLDDWVIYEILRELQNQSCHLSFCKRRGLGGYLLISGYRFGAEAERSVTLVAYNAFQGTPAVRYSSAYRDLERAEHIPSRTKLWPPPIGSQAPSVRITLFFLRKSTIALNKVPESRRISR